MADQIPDSTSQDSEEQLPQPTEEGAAPKEPKGAETEEVKEKVEVPAPQGRTYSEDEWRKAQSARDKREQKLRDDLKTSQDAHTQLAEQMAQMQEQAFVQQVGAQGGDENIAKLIVQRAQDVRKREQVLLAKEREQEAISSTLSQANKERRVHDLIKEFGLDESVRDQLLEVDDPSAMENKALRLAMEKSKTEQRPPQKVDKGRPTTSGEDFNKLPPSSRFGRLISEQR